MQRLGIDISKWQKGFDFDKAKAEGVEFIILRGAYSNSKDSCFEGFYKSCKDKCIPVGVYHYSMAKSVMDAKKEAELMLDILKGKQFEYPIYLDIEDKTQAKLGKSVLTSIIKTYCDTLEDSGYYVGIYSTYSYLNSYTNIAELCKYDKWIAQWHTKCSCPIDYGMWQFGGETNKIRSNKIAGVTCDQDYAYKDYPTQIKNAGLNGFKKSQGTNTTPTHEKPLKTATELAREVLDGKWGNGEDRKARLTAAGYDYKTVQAEVNRLLQPKKKTADELAREVLDGKWGNGADRKARLTAAGYNYDEIQAKVNELCKPKKTVDQLAREVIQGKWGTGLNRKQRLTAAGYDYNAVQKRVNQLM